LENLNILLVLLEMLEGVFEKNVNFSSNCQLRKEYPSLEKISSFDFARIHFFRKHTSLQSKMQTKKCERKQKRFFLYFDLVYFFFPLIFLHRWQPYVSLCIAIHTFLQLQFFTVSFTQSLFVYFICSKKP